MTPFPFNNTYATLPGQFYSRLNPVPVKSPKLVKINSGLADELGVDNGFLSSNHGIDILAGNKIADGSAPIAMAYGGHQFGNWAGRLGDGRAILLGEVVNKNGARFDVQLKGSGPTPYSRGGDGRAWIGPVLREYLLSEAMAALGIPTTRALAAVTTGENVVREEILPGAILTRVSKGHVRVGTFEYFASNNDFASIKLLADYVIARNFPDAGKSDNPYLFMLESIITDQAKLIARWMGVGFIHGVMNTDNMSVFGETIDYGPCAFMDGYAPDTVYSFIDQNGRYAYANQPSIASWNLTSLASTLLHLIDEKDEDIAIEKAQNAINGFSDIFRNEWSAVLCKKIGIENPNSNDGDIAREFLDIMAANKAD
ncbi:MAG: YdiU family protein, partial [Rhodospirillaceae bacterium]|nr:YdiU family protein [Rhodospirillaceae bacterium]